MIDPAKVALFIPPGLKNFKLKLFERIGQKIGRVVRDNENLLNDLPDDITPVVGCTPAVRPLINEWQKRGRQWIYWDRGYSRRVFATDLPVGTDGGFYRWHLNAFQLRSINNFPEDRWLQQQTPLWPWGKNGKHIVIAEPTPTYQKFHNIEGWTERTIEALKKLTDRPIVTRNKEMQRFGRKLHEDLKGAHALVAHGSNAAVESVIMGCPVFVDQSSAAALVGQTDLNQIEMPLYPERETWCRALAYSQFNEQELVDGTLWRLLT